MFRTVRLLPAVGAAIFFLASGIQASAVGAGFQATIEPDCVSAGQQAHLTIPNLEAGAVVSVNVTYTDSTSGGGAQSATGTPNGQGTFATNFTIPTTAVAGNAQVVILVSSTAPGINEAALGNGTFRIGTLQACASPGVVVINGSHFSSALSVGLTKTCDAGVSGNAVFSMSATLEELGRFTFPSVTVPCNGSAVLLPALPLFQSSVTLHETSAPANAVAAANVTFTVPPSAEPVTIHNAKAASAATPTPTPTTRVLARTGGGPSDSGLGMMAAMGGLLFAGTVGLLLAGGRLRRTQM